MASFHASLDQLVQAYEYDVGALRRELERCHRELGAGPGRCLAEPFAGVPAPLGPRPQQRVPRRPEVLVEPPEETTRATDEHPSPESATQEAPPEELKRMTASVSEVVRRLETMEQAGLGSSGGRWSVEPCPSRSRVGNLQIRGSEVSPGERCIAGPFEHTMGCVIMMNVLLTLVQLQVQGERLGASFDFLGGSGREELPANVVDTFFALEHVFNALFLVEFVVRVAVLRCKFFRSGAMHQMQWFNLLDSAIVLLCSMDLYLTPLTMDGQSSANLTFTRMLRFARLARTLKVIQFMRAFAKLRILMKTVAASVMSFMWSMTILGIFNLGSAIFLCQMLQPVMADETVDDDLRLWLYKMYGTSGRAVYTMFEFTFSGGWPTYARPVVEDVHWAFALFFVLYVSIVVFAVIRIITAMFLKDTLNIAARDAEFMVQESMKAKREYASKLKELFEVTDTSGNGTIDFDEFCAICSIPEVIHYFEILDLEISEVHALFDMLDDGDGQITYDEFVKGVIKLKGTARSMDVISMMREVEMIHKIGKRLEDKLFELDGAAGTSAASDAT